MSVGTVILWGLLVILAVMAIPRGDGTFEQGGRRAVEQFVRLAPRMLCALAASGFIAKLIPSNFIAGFLGEEAGLVAILVGSAVGIIVPAGPVVAFSIAAVFDQAGASVPALIAFITSWSLFAAHRIFTYEIPLLGPSFLRMRLASAAVLPLLAGLIAMLLGVAVQLGR